MRRDWCKRGAAVDVSSGLTATPQLSRILKCHTDAKSRFGDWHEFDGNFFVSKEVAFCVRRNSRCVRANLRLQCSAW